MRKFGDPFDAIRIGRDDQCPYMKEWMASLWRATVVNPIRLINSKTILQFRILGAWHQWRNVGRIVVTGDFLASFRCPFDRVPVQTLTSNFHHWTLRTPRKKEPQDRILWFGVQFTYKPITFGNELRTYDMILKTICTSQAQVQEAQWPIGYGVGLRIKRSSVRIRPWPMRWVLGQGSLLPLSQGETFTLASISYLAILVKYILAKKKKKKKWVVQCPEWTTPIGFVISRLSLVEKKIRRWYHWLAACIVLWHM